MQQTDKLYLELADEITKRMRSEGASDDEIVDALKIRFRTIVRRATGRISKSVDADIPGAGIPCDITAKGGSRAAILAALTRPTSAAKATSRMSKAITQQDPVNIDSRLNPRSNPAARRIDNLRKAAEDRHTENLKIAKARTGHNALTEDEKLAIAKRAQRGS